MADTAMKADPTSSPPKAAPEVTTDPNPDTVVKMGESPAPVAAADASNKDPDNLSATKHDATEPEATPLKAAADTENGDVDDAKVNDVDTPGAASAKAVQDTPASAASKSKKRKSTSGVPEHKSKKLNRKKSMPALHLDVQSGQYWYARMKGHPQWPAIVCDEAMLPESLLVKRPVSAWRPDGSYRADFEDGGKNVRDRRYPVMFLGTNEFYWMPNTDLDPLDTDEIKSIVEKDDRGKKSKALWNAFEIAAENQDLDYFKSMLLDHEKSRIREAQELADKEAQKKAKKEKKDKAKAQPAEDVEMVDAGSDGEKPKKTPSKKRKKDLESEGEGNKSSKTSKTKLKVNGPKEPAAPTPSKAKKLTKPKKAKTEEAPEAHTEAAKTSQNQRFADEEKNEKFRQMYFLRSVLQRGFLVSKPKADDMDRLDQHMTDVEKHPNVDGEVIRESRIHRVLKNIVKLTEIPREEEFSFKRRAAEMLEKWHKALAGDGEGTNEGAAKDKAPANGVVPIDQGERKVKEDTSVKEEASTGEEKEVNGKHEEDAKPKEEVADAHPPTGDAKANSEVKSENIDVAMTDAGEGEDVEKVQVKDEDARVEKVEEVKEEGVAAPA